MEVCNIIFSYVIQKIKVPQEKEKNSSYNFVDKSIGSRENCPEYCSFSSVPLQTTGSRYI